MPRLTSLTPPLRDTFRDRLIKRSVPITETGCWLFEGATNRDGGYGVLAVQRRPHYAHRVSWMAFRGQIPHGMNVLHKCDVPHCVNPDHLFIGSTQDNVNDKILKGRASPPPMQILSQADAGEIINRHAALTLELAKEYGVSRATILSVIRRQHLKERA